jgi:glycosyltransferase involved in cell wall biosynthesis
MIVKDEEANLARCLDSARDVVDEIIIVDTGSHDNTASIAQSYGAKVFYHEWDDNFSAARNVSLEHATGEWIFILDADEVLAQESKASFRALAKNNDMLGYYVLIQLHPEWTEGRRLSFFRNLPALRYHGIFHEELSITDDMRSKLGLSDVRVIHQSWKEDDQKKKINRNVNLLKKHLLLYPDGVYQILDLIRTYLESGNVSEVELLLEKAANLLAETESDTHRYTHYLGRYLLCLYRLQYLSKKGLPLEGVMPECEQALSLFPSSPLFYYEAAKISYKLKAYDKAISYFQKCISLGEDGTWDRIMIFPKDILDLKSFEGLGYCYFKKHDYGEALRYFEMSYRLHEDDRIKAMIHAFRILKTGSVQRDSLSAPGS